jgi:hypothetical protein
MPWAVRGESSATCRLERCSEARAATARFFKTDATLLNLDHKTETGIGCVSQYTFVPDDRASWSWQQLRRSIEEKLAHLLGELSCSFLLPSEASKRDRTLQWRLLGVRKSGPILRCPSRSEQLRNVQGDSTHMAARENQYAHRRQLAASIQTTQEERLFAKLSKPLTNNLLQTPLRKERYNTQLHRLG